MEINCVFGAQVKELLTSFGQLKAFNLVKDVTSGLSKVINCLKNILEYNLEDLLSTYLNVTFRVMHLRSIWTEVSPTRLLRD